MDIEEFKSIIAEEVLSISEYGDEIKSAIDLYENIPFDLNSLFSILHERNNVWWNEFFAYTSKHIKILTKYPYKIAKKILSRLDPYSRHRQFQEALINNFQFKGRPHKLNIRKVKKTGGSRRRRKIKHVRQR